MAPKRSDGPDTKRRRSVVTPVAKRARHAEDPSKALKTTEQYLKEVEEAVDKIDDVSDTGRELLRLMIKPSLAAFPEERDTFQSAAAKMVQEALQGVEHGLRAGQASAVEEVEHCQGSMQAKSQELCSSKQVLADRAAALNAAKATWLVDNKALQASRKALDAAKEELCSSREKLKEVVGCKKELEAAVETHMPAVISGSAASLQVHAEAIIPLLAQVTLESDSLQSAAMSSLRLAPEARGFFDREVLKALSAGLTKALEDVPAAEDEHAAVKAAGEAVAAAEQGFSEARAQMEKTSRAMWDAEIELQVAEGLEGEAAEAVEDAGEALFDADRHRQASVKQLADFREGPMLAFEALLNRAGRSAPVPEDEHPAAEEVPAVEKDAEKPSDTLLSPTRTASSKDVEPDRVPTPVRAAATERQT